MLLGIACGRATPPGATTPETERRRCTAALRFQEPTERVPREPTEGVVGAPTESAFSRPAESAPPQPTENALERRPQCLAENSQGDSGDRPCTTISLVLLCEDGTRSALQIGDEIGACYPIDSADALLRARCWWAGEGSLVEVRREGGALIVFRTTVDEYTGTGEPQRIGSLKIPPGAIVETL